MVNRLVSSVVSAAFLLTLGFPQHLFADSVEKAIRTTEIFANAIFAAVGSVTNDVTDDTVEADSSAVSLLVRYNPAVRLLGISDPLGGISSRPGSKLEVKAFADALKGMTTQQIDGNNLFTVVPLPFLDGCEVCHENFADDFNEGDPVGAVSVSVQIE